MPALLTTEPSTTTTTGAATPVPAGSPSTSDAREVDTLALDYRLLQRARSDRSARAAKLAAKAAQAADDKGSDDKGSKDKGPKDKDSKDKDSKDKDSTPEAVGSRYTTSALNVRTGPDEEAKVVTVLDPGSRVRITEETRSGWRQVIHDGEARWVRASYLSSSKPEEEPANRGLSGAPCPASSGGSGVEAGLRPAAVAVHRAVCAAFPFVSSYGGVRPDSGFHGSGQAVDIMVTGGAGDQIAAFVRAHAYELGVTEVIWQQRIWTTQRAGDGWRWMEDRGSATDNHYDHVHVSTH